MARPIKKGIDYFPLDVDVFENDKIFDVQNKYGTLGEAVYLRLVCLVYKNGYYFKFDSMDKLAGMVIRSIGSRWVESRQQIVEIIEFLLDCDLFSKTLAVKFRVLTSRGIQSRFRFATSRRRAGVAEYNLLDDEICGSDDREKVSEYDNEGFCGNNTTKESKVNESKVNESKVKEILSCESDEQENTADARCGNGEEKFLHNTKDKAVSFCGNIANLFNSVCSSLPKVSAVTDERIRAVKSAYKLIDGDFEGFFKRIENSDFLSGRNGRWLYCGFDWVLKPCNIEKILSGTYDNRNLFSDSGRGYYSGFKNANERDDTDYYNELKKLSVCY